VQRPLPRGAPMSKAGTASNRRTMPPKTPRRAEPAAARHTAAASAYARSAARRPAHSSLPEACTARAGGSARTGLVLCAGTPGSPLAQRATPAPSSRAPVTPSPRPPPPGAGGRAGSSTGRRGTLRAHTPPASWPGTPTRTGDCAARGRRVSRATSRGRDSAEIRPAASHDESAAVTKRACARRPDGTHRESGTPESVVSRRCAQS